MLVEISTRAVRTTVVDVCVLRGARYLTAFGPTVDGRSVLPFDVRRMTTAPAQQTGFGRVDLLLAIVDEQSKSATGTCWSRDLLVT